MNVCRWGLGESEGLGGASLRSLRCWFGCAEAATTSCVVDRIQSEKFTQFHVHWIVIWPFVLAGAHSHTGLQWNGYKWKGNIITTSCLGSSTNTTLWSSNQVNLFKGGANLPTDCTVQASNPDQAAPPLLSCQRLPNNGLSDRTWSLL